MNKIDIGNWSEFSLGGENGLFDIILPTGDIQAQKTDDGDYPLISSGKNNNGICKYIDKTSESKTIQANTITVDMFGKAFYHDYEYYCVSHGRVNILIPKFNITRNIGLYVTKVIENVTIPKYEFLDMCSQGVLIKERIKLPTNKNGEPDWEYMESYMKNIMQESEQKLEKILNIDDYKSKIDVNNWQKYKITDFFAPLSVSNKLTKIELEDGADIPVYSSEILNNGVLGYTNKEPEFIISEEVPFYLIFGDHTKSMNIAEANFCVMDNVKVLKPKINISVLITKYITTVWKSSIPNLGYARHWSIAEKTSILLPTNQKNEPDWEYMENYMKKIMEETQAKLDILSCCQTF